MTNQPLSWMQRFLKRGPVRNTAARIVANPAESAAGIVIVTLVVGALFYHTVEGWNLLNSVYFCVITLTTIGYGDFTPKTDLGKLFTIFYAFAGIGILATFIQLRAAKRLSKGAINTIEQDARKVVHELEAHDVLPFDP